MQTSQVSRLEFYDLENCLPAKYPTVSGDQTSCSPNVRVRLVVVLKRRCSERSQLFMYIVEQGGLLANMLLWMYISRLVITNDP